MPGLSATPCTRMPGVPSRDTMRCDRSPAPFDVPPRQHHDVAGLERAAHGQFERDFFVRKRAERHRLAAGFDDRGGDDGAVAVIDAAGPQRPAGLDQLIAGREHGDARAAHHVDRRKTARREHADLARADLRAAAQQRFAARDVGAGIGDELPARRGAAQIDRRRRRPRSSSVCSIITTASAPRGMTPPVAIAVAVPGTTSIAGATPQAITSALSVSRFGAPSLAPTVSAARTAKPSTLERSNGGASTGAITSAASTRPSAAASCTAIRRQAASDRCRLRNAGALPARKPLRGIAPAARRAAPHRGLPRRAGVCSGFMAMLLLRPWSHGDLRACWKTFAVGGNDDPAVAARQRCK